MEVETLSAAGWPLAKGKYTICIDPDYKKSDSSHDFSKFNVTLILDDGLTVTVEKNQKIDAVVGSDGLAPLVIKGTNLYNALCWAVPFLP